MKQESQGSVLWYDTPPKEYAKLYHAAARRSKESAARQQAEAKPWSEGEIKNFVRQARRLRAMALLCENSEAKRVGDVYFMGLDRPDFGPEIELEIIEVVERKYLNEADK